MRRLSFSVMPYDGALRRTGSGVSLRIPSGLRSIRRLDVSNEIGTPRRHAHRVGRADRDGRRRGAPRRRVSPDDLGPVSRDPELRPLRQGACVPGGIQERLDAHDQGLSGNRPRLDQQVSELGAGRPGEMGAGRLCHRARGFARRRAIAGISRRVVSARGARPARLHRMGGHATLVERQGRHQRDFLLRHEPVARGAAAPAASRRTMHLGRLIRLLPGAGPPWRHSLRLPGELVAPAGHERAIWRRGTRAQKCGHRRSGSRP